MKPDAMLTMGFCAVAFTFWAAWRERRDLVAIGLTAGTVYALASMWSFTWGQG